MAHISKNAVIDAPLDKVYAVARDPDRWAEWFVGLSEPEKLEGSGEVGTVAEFSYALAGMNFPVKVEVLEDEIGPRSARWKGRIEGPLAGQQTWTYESVGGGTEVAMELEYTVPGSALGKLADRLVIERNQERAAEQTMENLKELCEEGAG